MKLTNMNQVGKVESKKEVDITVAELDALIITSKVKLSRVQMLKSLVELN